MVISRLIHCGLVALLVVFLSAAASKAGPADTYKMQVQHSEKLPSLGPGLDEGDVFHEGTLENRIKPFETWRQLQDWEVGKWISRSQTNISEYDYGTGKTIEDGKEYASRTKSTRGHQKDSKGNVWHYVYFPKDSMIEGDAIVTRILYSQGSAIKNEPEQVVGRQQSTTIVIGKHSGRIINSFQTEGLVTKKPAGPDRVEAIISTKIFDRMGEPVQQKKARRIYERVGEFKPVDFANNKDLRASFHQYLLSIGRSDLIPR